jgi:hypothetical protein
MQKILIPVINHGFALGDLCIFIGGKHAEKILR